MDERWTIIHNALPHTDDIIHVKKGRSVQIDYSIIMTNTGLQEEESQKVNAENEREREK